MNEIYQVLTLLFLFGGFLITLLTYIEKSRKESPDSFLKQQNHNAIYDNNEKKVCIKINIIIEF